ncbi:alpha/beta hydrolase [Pseudarthrobacter sp. J75]|uniref:alpha/beta hydrolase n=1 Tax=unclassified Pseudarthrobacter TaxID=2647000 RepID=UPI002E80EC1E|nr:MULTISPECIES: alpha/beta hydrolase [unclassified Pseudarthrobacter]MEE2523324.1 alpha/beta hydrolase [Pseudarthrobacter sp. J47]MEE2529289.1 alpha/beta hydrolase [Pseudarthrobacter sp. J75]MEE2569170.1 alpha/beta hydrolase [Pseudarthrobacter sp. J64]
MEWTQDILGEGFQARPLAATGADGITRTATLIRHLPQRPETPAGRRRAVLFLHGWSDYFFNTDLAGFWTSAGYEFHALDMHNHGRSLQEGVPPGFVADLQAYDAEINAALEIVTGGDAGTEVTLMGHSLGGLVAVLWAQRHPGRVTRLILNSPWLEMHRGPWTRRAVTTMVAPLARFRPEAVLRLPERQFYWRSISSEADGEWTLDSRYRPPQAFPVRAAWLRAVLRGQAEVAHGLRLTVPVLVLLSTASRNGMVWTDQMLHTDAVLDVAAIAVRAATLGDSVTLERVDGALHDVFLSAPEVRADAFSRVARWLAAY